MAPPQQPKCVRVIGYAWMVLGVLILLVSLTELYAVDFLNMEHSAVGGILRLGSFVLIGVAGAGLASAPHFLGMEAWSRPVLESLTWVLLVFVLGFALFLNVIGLAARGYYIPEFSLVLNGVTLLFAAPLGFMLAYLRSDAVRSAMVDTPPDESDRSDKSEGSEEPEESEGCEGSEVSGRVD